jgi:hypothetical protein
VGKNVGFGSIVCRYVKAKNCRREDAANRQAEGSPASAQVESPLMRFVPKESSRGHYEFDQRSLDL